MMEYENKIIDYKETEWRKIVASAESNINGDCPLIEDEGILWANSRINELLEEKIWLEYEIDDLKAKLKALL